MTNREKITNKEKELLQNKTNQENLVAAMVMLENINRNYYGELNRNMKSRMNELLVLLKDKEQGGISIKILAQVRRIFQLY
jgi:hypothetical protein